MLHPGWITTLFFVFDLFLRLGCSVRVIMRRLPVGVALGWLTVILVFPVVGTVVYLFLGEHRLGKRRTQRIGVIHQQWQELLAAWTPTLGNQRAEEWTADSRLPELARSEFQAPLLPGNRIELLDGADAVFPALVAEIDQAQTSCDLAFYIWSAGGRVDDVAAALQRAAERGVRCRLLVDALGSAAFLKSHALDELRRHGIQVQAALPSGLLTMPFVRPDLRMHRKIVVVDRRVAFTGSMNMADPLSFKQDAGVGQWVDALARIEGATVSALAVSFLAMWSVEAGTEPTADELQADLRPTPDLGPARIQVLPSGPVAQSGYMEPIVLSALYAARKQVTLTSPYFVPSESLLTALLSVARSGVQVTLILPAHVDSRMVQHASRAYQSDLVAAGVHVALFEGGLLHTKSITVDDHVSLFGSLNLDPRSLRLNFEITLAVYDDHFTAALRQLQAKYLARSRQLDWETCQNRTAVTRLVEDTARLLGPVL